MAVDPETKAEYSNLISKHKSKISELDKELNALKKRTRSKEEKKLIPFFKIGMTSIALRQAEIRLKINGLSESMMGLKNSNMLDTVKKDVSNMFMYVESVVTLRTDESLNFNRDELDAIKPFNAKQRLNMHKYMKKIINDMVRAYGENTKWKWSFPDLWSKFAISAKNFFDFRELQATRDPRMEFYYDIQEYLAMVKEVLFFAAGENANKFRLSTKSPNDMNMGIRLLEDLRRIANLTNDGELVRKSKSGIDSYKAAIEAEEKKKKG